MKLEYVKLDDAQIQEKLKDAQGWKLEGGQLCKTFQFSDYMDGIDFATKVGKVAEDLNHHPDILITWRKVRVAVNTHDVQGISPYDFELARLVDFVL